MREINVTLVLTDPQGGDATKYLTVVDAMGDLIGQQLTDESGVTVDVFQVKVLSE